MFFFFIFKWQFSHQWLSSPVTNPRSKTGESIHLLSMPTIPSSSFPLCTLWTTPIHKALLKDILEIIWLVVLKYQMKKWLRVIQMTFPGSARFL